MNVLIIEAQMKQYRVPFYHGLSAALAKSGVALKVAYSDPPASEASKRDTCDLPKEYGVKVKAYWLVRERLICQVALGEILKADLVIVDQANKFVLNHLLLLLSLSGIKRIAFVGHGVNAREDSFWVSGSPVSRGQPGVSRERVSCYLRRPTLQEWQKLASARLQKLRFTGFQPQAAVWEWMN
jgi:hypothetical protein